MHDDYMLVARLAHSSSDPRPVGSKMRRTDGPTTLAVLKYSSVATTPTATLPASTCSHRIRRGGVEGSLVLAMSSSPPSSSDPLSSLRSLLEASSVPIPDDGTLAALLAVAGDDAGRAARLIIDDHKVSNPAAARATSTSPSLARDMRGLRRRPGAYQPLDFAENEEEYEAAVRGNGGNSSPGNPNGSGSLASLLYSALTLPFSALQSLLLGILRLLRLPSLFASIFSGGGPSVFDDGSLSAARQFEQDLAAAAASGPTSATLPPFLTGPYNDALKQAKRELKMLVVVLTTSSRNDNDRAFLK